MMTIVILIILTSIVINLTIGENGLFNKAKIAGEDYKYAANKESEELRNVETVLKNTIDKIQLNDLKVGDYIEYDTEIDGVGKIMCRVLYEEASENKLQIISDKNICNIELGYSTQDSNNAYYYARPSYNTAIQTLNTKAEKYINAKYVIDARCVGTVPIINEERKMVNKNSEATTYVTLKFYPGGTGSSASGCKAGDNNYVSDWENLKVKQMYNTGEEYWLASRVVSSGTSMCLFNMRYSNSTENPTSFNMYVVHAAGNIYGAKKSYGLRVCFSLSKNIEIVDGDGKTELTAYKMKSKL